MQSKKIKLFIDVLENTDSYVFAQGYPNIPKWSPGLTDYLGSSQMSGLFFLLCRKKEISLRKFCKQ